MMGGAQIEMEEEAYLRPISQIDNDGDGVGGTDDERLDQGLE